MNVVLIIPTGIGAEIGGHAGDALPVARLIASSCDILITHPNVLNASDINEMTENTLYVEGSILDRFLWGEIKLKTVKSNRILVAVNPPVPNNVINSVSAARMTLGADIFIVELETPLEMIASFDEQGKATGEIKGHKELVEQVKQYYFDALAITTPIIVPEKVAFEYLEKGTGVNPWGGVEAKASKLIASELDKPVAHAPCGHTIEEYNEVVEPRLAAEVVSISYLHCILKGLHKAPRVSHGNGICFSDIDCLITPINCVGEPHRACISNRIPVIVVAENTSCLNDSMPIEFLITQNYLEATGMILAMKMGITLQSLRRPVPETKVIRNKKI